jgi:O-antigen/teichoic acid export membrane protein
MSGSLHTNYISRLFALVTGSGFKAQLIRGGIGSAAILATSRLLALALGIILARTLGAEGYGIYAYAFAIMSLFMVAAEAGVPTLLMREVSASQGREEWALLRGALKRGIQFVSLVAASVSVLGLFVLWMLAEELSRTMVYTVALMLLVLPFSALCKTVASALRGLHRVVIGQAIDLLARSFVVLLIVSIVFLLWPSLREPYVAMAAQLFGAVAVMLVGAWLLRRLTPLPVRKIQAEYHDRAWLRSALPFALIGGAGVVNSQTDLIMLGWFTSAGDVGVYSVAVQGATLVAFGLQAANMVVAPQFSRIYAQKDMVRLQHLVTQSARVILMVALPVALIFILAGEFIIPWVFGAEFSAAHAPLAILAMGQLVNAGFGSVGFLLNMTGYERISSRILWQTALLNILLNAIMIPLFGIVGASVATAISLVIWNALLYREVRKHLRISSTAFQFTRK